MSENVPTAKVKTKAKSRYLKGKRDRRKLRKALDTAKKPKRDALDEETLQGDELAEEEEEMAKNEELSEDVDDAMDDVAPTPIKAKKEKKEKRVKKKRKKEATMDGDDEDLVEPQEYPAEEQINPLVVETSIELVTEVPEDTLIPSFPLPTQPAMPSKAQMLLQGMDDAMLDAEIVDPSLVSRIDADSDASTHLSERMKKRLADLGIVELFAVQTKLIPFLLPVDAAERALYQPYNPPRDVCASAPTGSGKTLAYVVPIVEVLASRIVTRLRALIVLPTRDLVQQVRETFEACCKGTKLQIASATGQHSFAHEQTQIVGNITDRFLGGSSRADILICTPGRLIDHLDGTPNFTLQHLRFLVVDEADRLLSQSFQDWLKRVLRAIHPPQREDDGFVDFDALTRKSPPTQQENSLQFPSVDAIAPSWLPTFFPYLKTEIDETSYSSCQKLLFSATLTRDPAKIALLELRNPKYFIVRGKEQRDLGDDQMEVDDVNAHEETFETPATLREWMFVCEPSQKPLYLFYLVRNRNVADALVFTKSAESTTRLMRLFQYFESAKAISSTASPPLKVEAFSSDLTPSQRKRILDDFKTQKVDILICSDLVSRGMDIAHVSHVINYDVPIDIRKYVHRVGRTARAGREGDAWSLVEEQETHHFKAMMREAKHLKRIKKLKVQKSEMEGLERDYQTALNSLRQHYSKGK